MDRRDLANGIRKSWEFLNSVGLAEAFAYSESLPVDENFRDMLLRQVAGHSELYSACLQTSHYNILAFDHSFFQFSVAADDEVRYSYYPNPHVSGPAALHRFRQYRELLESGTIVQEDFERLVREMRSDGHVPVLRYENAPRQYFKFRHPCSHLHIGVHSENRWAVRRLLTPLSFTMLVVKHFFSEEWNMAWTRVGEVDSNQFEELLLQERANCRILGPELFADEEEMSFHFS